MDIVEALAAFGYTPRTAYRQLVEAKSPFYRVEVQKRRTVVKIYGLLTVCKALGSTLAGDKHGRLVDADQFNNLHKRDSQLYASIHKPYDAMANPMTRQVITELTGLSIMQQRRYEKTAGVKRTANFEVEYNGDGKHQIATMQVAGKSRYYTVARRLGNIYHTNQGNGRKGQAVKVHKALQPRRASFLTDGVLRVRKCFFSSLQRLTRAFRGYPEGTEAGFVLVRNRFRAIKGRMEWCWEESAPPPPLPPLPLFEWMK
jgi:hypothetical protein